MNNECITYFEGAYTQKVTVHAGYAMTGKTLAGPKTGYQGSGPALAPDPLAANDGGNMVVPVAPVAGGEVSGVISWDVPINGKAVIIDGDGTVLPITSGGAVAIGDLLQSDAQGRVITAAPASGKVVVGKARSAAGAAGVDVVVELYTFNPAVKA